ncbi:beta-galactosidase family protein [Pedobacter sp. V48]|uniref:glycoside hydrolase family 35 protein n=1 Tax=Pedobacter sp. V48 TaxID=509635 RepID=UPI0003E565B1|nr:beta-galactosidase family protein [Pedobacter sp. V48]ETZ24715.1 hypothetical protein N824_00395 [Pedobacter sp. V48]
MKIFNLICLSAVLLLLCGCSKNNAEHTFELGDNDFLLDGKPFQIVSGEIHYPRVPREAWRDRMKMAKAMGLNTIGTYVFWNAHEPEKDVFDFSGNNDIAEFVKIAQQEGLWVILRPSPYVCAEWEFGGYPYWLQNEQGLKVRSREKQYLEEYRKYIHEVGKQLAPLQVNHGGNVLMVQIENEYGSYGCDKEYLRINREMFIDAGFDGLLYTCDPQKDIKKGFLPGTLPAINGQDNPEIVKKEIRELNGGKGPFFIAEWYPAWFDWWGTPHHKVPAEQYTGKLDSVLAAGISINMYMFHGGSTRAFMNGANYRDTIPYEPQISSYDYDAPLDEAGNPTEKFMKFRAVIEKHLSAGAKLPAVPAPKPAVALDAIPFSSEVSIYDYLEKSKHSIQPLTFEDLNQAYGYVLYRTIINGGKQGMLKIDGLKDFGLVYVNGKRQGILDRRLNQDSLMIDLPSGKVTLDILVENMGRINFGPFLLQNKKGITGKVTLAGAILESWDMFSLPFDKQPLKKEVGNAIKQDVPMLKYAEFELKNVQDTYLDMRKWGKGVVWVNGHNLGKYWSIGPQQTIYLPAEWLKKGKNQVVVLDLLKTDQQFLPTLNKPILDQVITR